MIKIIGLIIIIASFVFVLKSPDKSMMDRLMEKKRDKILQDAEAAEKAEADEAANSPDPLQK